MLKDSAVQSGIPARSDFKITVNAKTGQGVVISNYAAKTVDFPSAATDDDIYLVDKERIPTGINTAYTQYPDSFDEFNTVVNGDFVKLRKYPAGSEFNTTEVANVNAMANAVGKYMLVDTNGNWDFTANSGADASKYTFTGTANAGSTVLYNIMVGE